MAARSNKIFGEVLFKQYKYKPKIVSPISRNVRHLSQNLTKNTTNPFVTASVRLNEIIQNSKLNKNPTDPYLQPALLPNFEGHRNKKNDYTKTISTPSTINQTPKGTKPIYTISKRKTTVGAFNPTKVPLKLNQNRQYSTLLSSTRHYSSAKHWGNQAEEEKCEKRRECYKACPKWQMHNCPPQGDNLQCNKPYTDPCCQKKLAPYPSFSETCAERLDDDPSECMQCPWKRCGGAGALNYPKRKYHTATVGAFHRFKMTTLPLLKITETILPVTFDAKKPPCRRPPGKCYKPPKVVECPKKESICPPPFEKKKCNREPKKASEKWTDAYKMWTDKNNIVLMNEGVKDMHIMTSTRETDDDCQGEMVKPDDCCRKSFMDLARQQDTSRRPPCPSWRKPSRQCPKPDKCRKPYRQEHDLNEPVYRRAKKPYFDIDTGHGERKPSRFS